MTTTRPITFGAFVPQGWQTELIGIEGAEAQWAKAVEIAKLAEDLGYDSIWVFDHFHNVPHPVHETVFECWTTLAALSQVTSRVRLGQMVGCASYRNPGLLAKITSNIDVMSGGRLDWGIGAGWYDHEYKGYGYEFLPAKDRIRVLRETVEIVTSLWTEPDTSYEGRFFESGMRAAVLTSAGLFVLAALSTWWRGENATAASVSHSDEAFGDVDVELMADDEPHRAFSAAVEQAMGHARGVGPSDHQLGRHGELGQGGIEH